MILIRTLFCQSAMSHLARMQMLLLFLFFILPVLSNSQSRYDIIIDEIMVDPSPLVGLPNNEWIELKNNSNGFINIQNWRIGEGNSESGPFPDYLLPPGSFIIISGNAAVAQLSAFGPVIGVTNFPSLPNDDGLVYLISPAGSIIHAINYSVEWYGNELKKDGGWTLEMIDTKQPCTTKSNWASSSDSRGGTPGMINSIDGNIIDIEGPRLLNAYATDSATLLLVFDKPVDSLSGSRIPAYSIDQGQVIVGVWVQPPLYNNIRLTLDRPLRQGIIYTISVGEVADCSNNRVEDEQKIKVGWPVSPVPGDWIINEIMTDPKPNGYDYIEIYNNSSSMLDAAELYIANRNSSQVLGQLKRITSTPHYIFPGEYLVVTPDPGIISLQYLVEHPSQLIALSSMPSFPDDEGTVVILDAQGRVLDEVHYNKDWHFKLLKDVEGVALEKIDPLSASHDPSSWHSASASAGYGTPTSKNSQSQPLAAGSARLELSPAIVSPDNDGRDDFVRIYYHMDEPGFVATLVIFNVRGQPVRVLAKNEILGTSGYWRWDGLGEQDRRLPAGNYIIYLDTFSLQGKKEILRKLITVAKKWK